ncbi:PIN-like domain-containing protein [Nonomuraea sp. B1E8]|uniref:PIN-like domain-containing protein n=1 Tax=unclassified Nonomuraea TaxID=2593643 RepID=UPI00325DC160
MADVPGSRHETAGIGGGLREQFPGYFPPSDKDLKHFITEGLIAFDTNALFDLYRFNKQAREEYLASMRLLADRLWAPNRVAEELLDRRLEVIRECSQAISKLTTDLDGTFETLRQQIRSFGNRRGLSPETRAGLEEMINKSSGELLAAASKSFTFELNVDNSIRTDPILGEIERVLDGKVGLSRMSGIWLSRMFFRLIRTATATLVTRCSLRISGWVVMVRLTSSI